MANYQPGTDELMDYNRNTANSKTPVESCDYSFQPLDRQNRSSTSDINTESLRHSVKVWISREELSTQDDETEVEQQLKHDLTASTPREKMFEKIIQEYIEEIDHLKFQLKKGEELQQREGIGQSGLNHSQEIAKLNEELREILNEQDNLKETMKKKEPKFQECKDFMVEIIAAIKKQKEVIANLEKECNVCTDISSGISHKRFQLTASCYKAIFRKRSNTLGFKFSIRHGRLFLNESNIVIAEIKVGSLIKSDQHIRSGDFIMAVGECDVTSLTEDEFKDLIERNFLQRERIELTLRQAPEKKYKELEVKLGDYMKNNSVNPKQISLALIVCKDNHCRLPNTFPLENYDIIEKINRKPTRKRLDQTITKTLFNNETTMVIKRYFDTKDESSHELADDQL